MTTTDTLDAPTPDRDRLVRRALGLAWFTIGYNLLEGLVSMAFGIQEGSWALFGFGADSMIEVASAVLVLLRFRGEASLGEALSLQRERRATLGIGILFVLLAVSAAGGAVVQLVLGVGPTTTVPGVIVAAVSLSFMFWLWRTKSRLATELDSASLRSDARCSLACLELSVVLLVGSGLFMLSPALFWTDSAAAIVLALLIGREGVGTIRHARSPTFTGGCGCSDASSCSTSAAD